MLPSVPALPDAPILVVDDDPKIVALVRMYLERERFAVVTAGDGREALRAIEQHAPRLVVLDLMIPEIDGFAVIRRARELGDVPILILSARGAVGDRIQGLSEGADDYLPKPFSPAELVLRVKTILRRSEKAPPIAATGPGEVLALGDLVLDPGRHRVTVGGEDVAASSVELRLLAALLDADGRVLSRVQLLDAVYGEAEGDVTDRAIDQYVKRLREKLGDGPAAPRYVETVRGTGYRAAGRVVRRREG
jgi:two-component system, OmpR family, alkaline phosphatase synthesis response regulator PhoP